MRYRKPSPKTTIRPIFWRLGRFKELIIGNGAIMMAISVKMLLCIAVSWFLVGECFWGHGCAHDLQGGIRVPYGRRI